MSRTKITTLRSTVTTEYGTSSLSLGYTVYIHFIYRLSVIFASLVSGNNEELQELPEEGETSFCNCFNLEVSSYIRDTLHTHIVLYL